jgi:squalene-hopene/tetraprenyl-beta-curcumene cyclase
MITRREATALLLGSVASAMLPRTLLADDKKLGPAQKDWDAIIDKALAYCKKAQGEDGSWSGNASPGVTGVVLTGILTTGKLSAKDPMVEKGLKYVESLINPKAGHIAGKDPKNQLLNYVTCINVLALTAAERDSYKTVVKDATKFLRELQWDDSHGKPKTDDFFGGAGYDSKSRPDLSNTQFFLDALVAAGVPKNDPAFQKAIVFVSRCQNIKDKEYNDQPWAAKIDDGSFVYSAAGGGSTKVVDKPEADGSLPGYGSMTYAGIKSLIYCGLTKDDQRVKKAYAWIQKNYTVDRNPGMPKGREEWGLYYYYHTMAKCLEVLGLDEVVDANKVAHDWRADITAALAKRQEAEGSWKNSSDHWMEGDPNIVTGYALMALAHCKPKK